MFRSGFGVRAGFIRPEALQHTAFPSSSRRRSPAVACPRTKAVRLRLADAAQLMGSLLRVL